MPLAKAADIKTKIIQNPAKNFYNPAFFCLVDYPLMFS